MTDSTSPVFSTVCVSETTVDRPLFSACSLICSEGWYLAWAVLDHRVYSPAPVSSSIVETMAAISRIFRCPVFGFPLSEFPETVSNSAS